MPGEATAAVGEPVQIAYAVPDVDEAAARWVERFGAGPFFVLDHIPLTEVRYRGQPATFDHSSAYGQWGRLMVELVQDHTLGPSPVRDLVPHGSTALHHVAYFVADMATEAARLIALGWPEALFATTPGGQGFAFHDATNDLGHMIEIYEPTDRLVAFYRMVADAAVDWRGERPVRRLNRSAQPA